jgi:hypothetical protein
LYTNLFGTRPEDHLRAEEKIIGESEKWEKEI